MNRINSQESGQRPLTNVNYARAPANDEPFTPAAAYSSGSRPRKAGRSKWLLIGVPLLLLVLAGAIVGAILGVRAHNNKAKTASTAGGSGASGAGSSSAGGASPSLGNNELGLFPTATDAYFLPVYPSATNTAAYIAPTFLASATASWPAETFVPATPAPTSVRPDRPRLIAPAARWAALPALIKTDPYLKFFHNQIMQNATTYSKLPPVAYVVDGDSGILDVSRQVKQRLKAYSYAFRMTQDQSWLNFAWAEIENAIGPTFPDTDKWNSGHFLDVAEMTSGFAIAYDWLHDAWSDTQRTTIASSIVTYGLNLGVLAYGGKQTYSWWTGSGGTVISGNWNCVCNGGLTLGALAILGDDTSGIAESILAASIPNANANCVLGPSSDGTWTETPNYWYFGTTGHAEMASALLTATGDTYGLLDTNPSFHLTGLYHMHVFGMTSLFDYADHGPNKYSTTANSMMFYATAYKTPEYMLYQRDRFDAPEPWAMFWYDPSVAGAWWNGVALDHQFADPETSWAAMRSSWTDDTGLYIAMKSSKLTGHQTHGDLDCGDFVLDAMGQRWAGELGSGDYLSTAYFSSELDDAVRWLYYRKRTEGQNTLVIGGANQLAVEAAPTAQFGSTGDAQGSSTVLQLGTSSTAYFTTDMSSAYGSGSSVVRGLRTINGRRQVLLQDDVSTTSADLGIQWRMHTNATVTLDSAGTTATLTLKGETLTAALLNPPAGAQFATGPAVRLSTDPALPAGQVDQPNPGVTVLSVSLPGGAAYSLQVLFTPQWAGVASSAYVTPAAVPVGQWSTTSHP